MDTFLLDLFFTAVLGGLLGLLCCIKGLRLSGLDTVHRIRSDFFMIVVNSFFIRCYRDMLQNDMCLHAFYQEQHLPTNFAFNQQFWDVQFPNGQWMSMSRSWVIFLLKSTGYHRITIAGFMMIYGCNTINDHLFLVNHPFEKSADVLGIIPGRMGMRLSVSPTGLRRTRKDMNRGIPGTHGHPTTLKESLSVTCLMISCTRSLVNVEIQAGRQIPYIKRLRLISDTMRLLQ